MEPVRRATKLDAEALASCSRWGSADFWMMRKEVRSIRDRAERDTAAAAIAA